jgi:hypothetical protein
MTGRGSSFGFGGIAPAGLPGDLPQPVADGSEAGPAAPVCVLMGAQTIESVAPFLPGHAPIVWASRCNARGLQEWGFWPAADTPLW